MKYRVDQMEITTSLIQAAENKEGTLTKTGSLATITGEHTARCAKSKFIVDEGVYPISFNKLNQRMSPNLFSQYWLKAEQALSTNTRTQTYQVGNNPTLNIHVHVKTEFRWHQSFANFLFLPQLHTPLETWSLLCTPSVTLSPEHPTLIAISFKQKKVLICGTAYAGEIKKAMFSVLNTILPHHDTLPMHCSAVLSPTNTTTLIFGLSGTGKTTLSSDDSFRIIGDDEHGWSRSNVFNFEGGCYAKVANLSQHNEPQIFHATQQPCIFENIVLNEDLTPDFQNTSLTENTRCAYPLSYLPKAHDGLAPPPSDVVFLCCDLYGVFPALSLLTPKQAIQYFSIGYTAKVGSTEQNSLQPIVPISSPCFGQPFFPLPLGTYTNLLAKRLKQHNSRVWLVNTGWQNSLYPNGKRYPIQLTKDIIHHIVHQKITNKPNGFLSELELQYFTHLPNGQAIDFSKNWRNSALFSNGLKMVNSLFHQINSNSLQYIDCS